jgi:very-short-patch-repair endonuclease
MSAFRGGQGGVTACRKPPLNLPLKGGEGNRVGFPLYFSIFLSYNYLMVEYNFDLTPYARKLRKRATDAERKLWARVRRKSVKGVRFYRQKIIGSFIVDFYCPEAKLVVEVDGGQHFFPEGRKKDRERERYLKSLGIKVIRFTDLDVLLNIDGVMQKIWENV